MAHRLAGPTRFTVPRVITPAVVTLLTLLATCTQDRSPLGPGPWRTPTGALTANPPTIFVGAGDIADCNDIHDEETASLLDGITGTVFAAGDDAYEDGTTADFQNCYDPTWGRHKARTRPVPGNHEYNTPGGAGYFGYFGAAAGEAGKGFYSYDLGDWHIIALNNYISMDLGSEQDNWLRADLSATTKACKLAYYHEPLYSSTTGTGTGGVTNSAVRQLFTTLYAGGVDVVVNGHRHFYERLAPMNPDGQPDNTAGIREFIAGTGGASIGNPTNAFPLSEVRFGSSNYGVLKFYLYSDSYAWRFVPVLGKTLSDTGSFACHGLGSGVSASQSTVTAVPSTITVGGHSTITATVKDGFGSPVSGAAVALTVNPNEAGTTLTPASGTTDANGVMTSTLTSTVLGEKTVSASATLGGVTTALSPSPTVTVSPPSVITHTLLTTGNDVVNQKVYSTTAISPAANTLVTVAVLTQRSTGAPASPVLSGGGMTTWTEVGSTTFDTGTLPLRRLTLFRAMSAAPGSGPLTITYSATVSHCQWIVSQWGGVDLSGVNGAGAIVQTGSSRAEGVTGLTVSLAAFANANDVAYGAFGVTSKVAVVTPGSGFTEISEQASGESTPGDLEAEFRTNDNTIYATWPVSLNAGALGLEIKSAASGSGAGVVDAVQSTLSAAPAALTAGSATSTITVTARDANGMPVSGATVVLAATGSGNTVTQPGPTNAQGVATGTLSSTTAETKTVSATANGTALSQHAAVSVTAGPVSATHSTISASPTSIAAGGQASDITVMVKDAFDNPINGAAVQLAATPAAGVIVTQPSPTDASGASVGALSSAVAEDKVVSAMATVGGITTALTATTTVTVTPQGASVITHTLLTAGNNPVNTTVYTTASIAPASNALVTVAVLSHRSTGASPSPTLSGGGMTGWTVVSSTTFDTGTLPLRRLTIYRAMSATPGSGPITITFTNNQSHCQWIVSQWDGVDVSGVNGAGAIVQTGSSRAEAVSGLTVALAPFGTANNVAYGAFGVVRNVAVVTPGSGFAEISEQPSGESTSGDLQAEWRSNDNTIDATWPLNLNAGAVGLEIKAAASGSGSIVDPALSTVEAAPTAITPGGAGSTIEVTVRDANGAPVTGATVEVSATGTGNTLPPPGPTDAAGVYTGIFTSTKAESKIISATARIGTVTTALSETETVTVTPGPVSTAQSTIGAAPTTITAATGSSTITVTVKDAHANPISGATVQLAATGSGNTLSGPGSTGVNGVYQGTLSSTDVGDKVVSATATVGAETTPLTATVTVTVASQFANITQTLLTIGTNPANQRVYTTASVAPAAGTLITIAVLEHSSLGTPPVPTVSGGGMAAWDMVATTTFDPGSSPQRRLTIFRAMSAGPGSGSITITSAMTLSHCQWLVSQWDGAETSGANGAGAIVQTGSITGDAVNGLTVPLAPFGDAHNVGYGVFGVRSALAAVTPGAGFTEIGEQPSGESTAGDLEAEWAANLAAIAASWTNLNGGALGVEIKARTRQ